MDVQAFSMRVVKGEVSMVCFKHDFFNPVFFMKLNKVFIQIKYLKLQKYSIVLVGEVKSDICLFFYIQIYAK